MGGGRRDVRAVPEQPRQPVGGGPGPGRPAHRGRPQPSTSRPTPRATGRRTATRSYFDRRADYVKAARAYRPEIQFSLATNQFPTALRQDTTINGNPYKILDTEDPEIYAKLADWYFGLFQAFDRRGAPVDILNVVNEPDLDVCPPNQPLQCRPYHYGYGRNPQKGTAEIFARAVPLFKAKFADPAQNPTGMEVPVIMGPSTFAPGGTGSSFTGGGALGFVRYYKENRPEAWDQIDWVATHQYQNGVRGDLFQALQAEAGDKPIVQSETHASKDFGPPTLADPVRTSLSLAQLFGAAVNFGTRSWWYFNTIYPNDYTPAGLMQVPNQANAPSPDASPVPYKQYYAFRQLTSAQPLGSDVLDYTASAGRRADVVAFREAGEDTVYVTVTNTEAGPKSVALDAEGAAGARALTRYTIRTTDATHDDEVTADVALAAGTTTISVDLAPYSVNTFTVTMGPAGATAGGDGPEPGALALAQNAPNPTAGQTTVSFALAEAADVELAVFDVLGKEVVRVVDGPRQAGDHRVTFDASGLAAGVYVYRLRRPATASRPGGWWWPDDRARAHGGPARGGAGVLGGRRPGPGPCARRPARSSTSAPRLGIDAAGPAPELGAGGRRPRRSARRPTRSASPRRPTGWRPAAATCGTRAASPATASTSSRTPGRRSGRARTYHWAVRAWDRDGEPSGWAASSWTTGRMGDWGGARWVGLDSLLADQVGLGMTGTPRLRREVDRRQAGRPGDGPRDRAWVTTRCPSTAAASATTCWGRAGPTRPSASCTTPTT